MLSAKGSMKWINVLQSFSGEALALHAQCSMVCVSSLQAARLLHCLHKAREDLVLSVRGFVQ